MTVEEEIRQGRPRQAHLNFANPETRVRLASHLYLLVRLLALFTIHDPSRSVGE
jgi:hypothetical protein